MYKISKLAELAFITKRTVNYYSKELLVHLRLIEALKQKGLLLRKRKQQLENTSHIENKPLLHKDELITTSLYTTTKSVASRIKGLMTVKKLLLSNH